jgi:NitT/TauT family transport system substrate-binding protein
MRRLNRDRPCPGLRLFLYSLILLLSVALVPGLRLSPAMAQGSAGANPEKANLKVGIVPISNLTPLYVAQKLGYFRDVGLNVETTISGAGPALIGALIGGSLDLTYVNYVTVFQANTQGFPLTIVAHQNSAQESPPDAAPMMIRSDGEVTKPADLANKRIAINALNNINSLVSLHYLDKNGVAPDRLQFVEVPFPNMGDALLNRQVDAAIMVEPFVTLMMKSGAKIKPLGYPFLELAPGMDIAGFVAADKFVDANPITVERFVAALARANHYLNGNRAELVKYTAEFTKSNPDLVQQLTLDRWSQTVNEQNLQLLADTSYRYGLLKSPLTVSKIIYKTARK